MLLGLGALAAGAYYLAKRGGDNAPEGMHHMPDGTLMPDAEMPGAYQPGGAEPWGQVPDEIFKKYQSIIYGHGTAQDCVDVLAYVDRLEPETQVETDWLAGVRSQVAAACEYGAVPVASNPPILPAIFPTTMIDNFNYCWTSLDCDVNAVVNAMTGFMNARSDFISSENFRKANGAILELQQRYAGVSGRPIPHVGDCGCASCEAKRIGHEEESCCDACAKGVGRCSCQSYQPEEVAGGA